MEKWLKPRYMGTHFLMLSKSIQMNTNMTGCRWFSKYFAFLCLGRQLDTPTSISHILLSLSCLYEFSHSTFFFFFIERRFDFGKTYGDTTRSLEICHHQDPCFGDFMKTKNTIAVNQSMWLNSRGTNLSKTVPTRQRLDENKGAL